MRIPLLLILGLLLWLAEQFLALCVGGGGHGWTAPFLATIPLAVLYPIAMIKAFSPPAKTAFAEVALIIAAILLDLYVVLFTIQEAEYFGKVWQIGSSWIVAWVALWLGWQALAIYSLVHDKSRA